MTQDNKTDNDFKNEVKEELSREETERLFKELGDVKQRAIRCISKSVLHEEKNIEKLLDTGMSAFTGEPINLIVEGPPSEGKTFMIVNTLKVFPEEYVEIYRDASPKSFTREKGQLALRIIEDEEKKVRHDNGEPIHS